MCIGFPGLVVAIDAEGAVVETDGRRRRASTVYLTDVDCGDWVTVAAGTIVERIDPAQAAEIQSLLRAAIDRQSIQQTTSLKEGAFDVHAP